MGWLGMDGDGWVSYGITRVLEGGHLLEKAAANVSIIRGHLSAARAEVGWDGMDQGFLPSYSKLLGCYYYYYYYYYYYLFFFFFFFIVIVLLWGVYFLDFF